MAGPLSVFRKYQAFFLVAFGVVLMIAFIVAPPLDDYLRSQSGNTPQGNPVVVDSKYGELREGDLESMRRSHGTAMYFLNELVQETYRREGTPKGQGFFTSDTDSDLVHTYLLAKKAESMGLVVSDQAIVEFLEQLSDGIEPGDIGEIMRQALGGRTPEAYVLDQLRVELLAMRMRAMSQAGLFIPPRQVVTPIHAWQYFKRLNHRVKAEIVPFEVAALAANITAKPTAAELTDLYEAGKDRFPDPDRPEPGFKRRRKAKFQYVRFEFNQFLEDEQAQVIDAITDEEIEQHYEQNKQRYEVRASEPDIDEPAAGEPETGEPAQDPDAAEGQAPGEGAADAPEDSKPEQAVVPEGTKPETAGPQPADPSPAEKAESGANDEPTSTEEDGEKADQQDPEDKQPEQKEPADNSSSSLDPSSGEVFISLNDVASEQSESTVSTEQAASDEEATSSLQPLGNEPQKDELEEENAVKKESSEITAGDEVAPTPEAAAGADSDEPATPEAEPKDGTVPSDEQNTLPETEPQAEGGSDETETIVAIEYRPLDDELRAEIRDELARNRAQALANDRIVAAKEQVRAKLSKVTRDYRKWTIANEGDETPRPFPHLDVNDLELDELAAAGSTPVVDSISVQDFDEVLEDAVRELGRSARMPTTFTWPPQQFPFHQEAFVEGVPFYSVGQTGSESTVSFLYWRIQEEPEYVPDFKEARDEVEAAWRKAEAFEQAKHNAGDLVDRVGSSGKTLADFFSEDEDISKEEIIETNEFSWMSTGFNPASFGAPALSHVDGVEKIGTAFMQDVFKLKPGDVGVANNEPKTFIYLVRVASESTVESQAKETLLRQRFLQSGISSEIGYIAEVESFELRRKWQEDLEAEMGVEWLRPPVNDRSAG